MSRSFIPATGRSWPARTTPAPGTCPASPADPLPPLPWAEPPRPSAPESLWSMALRALARRGSARHSRDHPSAVLAFGLDVLRRVLPSRGD